MLDSYLLNKLLKIKLKDKTFALANKSFDYLYSFINRSNIKNKDKILNRMHVNDKKLKKGIYYGYRIGESLGLGLIGTPIYRNISDTIGGIDTIKQNYKNNFKRIR